MQISSSLLKATKVLIVPSQEGNIDILAACFGLAEALKSNSKEVSMLLSAEVYSEHLQKHFPPKDIKFVRKNSGSNFVITLDKVEGQIKEVKWKEEAGKLNIFITTETGEINPGKVNIEAGLTNYDLIIVVGIKDILQLGEFATKHTSFDNEKTYFVNKEKPLNFSNHRQTKGSHSETLYGLLLEIGINIPANALTYFLAGINWNTNGFKQKTNSFTFKNAAEIVAAGADPVAAANIAFTNISFAQSKFFSEVFAKVKTNAKGIVYSRVNYNSLKANSSEQLLFSNLVPIAELAGTKAAFVITEGGPQTHAFIKANDSSIDLRTLFAGMEEWNGTKGQGTLVSKETTDNLETMLIGKFEADLKQPKPIEGFIPEQNNLPKTVEPEITVPVVKPAADLPQFNQEQLTKLKQVKQTNTSKPDAFVPAQERATSKNAPVTEPPKPVTQPQTINQTPVKPSVPEQAKPQTPKTTPEFSMDPLAPASEIPKPLNLDENGNEVEEQQPLYTAPTSPLPPANI